MSEDADSMIPISNYVIRLLYDKKPVLDNRTLLEQLQTIDRLIEPIGESEVLMSINRNHCMMDVANNPSSPVVVCVAEGINQQELNDAVSQTWDWPAAESIVPECSYAVLISDMNGQMLKSKDRLENIQKVLAAVHMLYPPKAVHWPGSQRIVNPIVVSETLRDGQFGSLDAGAVNVRLFNVGNEPGEMVMDTLGLAFFSLPDLQCHFSKLEPAEVASCLYNWANYLFDKGAIIESGNTIDGCDGKPWQCNWEWSLVEPRRQVIDLHSGK